MFGFSNFSTSGDDDKGLGLEISGCTLSEVALVVFENRNTPTVRQGALLGIEDYYY